MQRRAFLELTAGLVASSVLIGRAPGLLAKGRAKEVLDEKRFHASRRFVQTSFGRIAYVERGSGEAALFLHGFPLNGFQWRGALERLSPHRRCIAPDFMGLGYTEVAEGQSVAPDAQVAMLIALLDTLGIASVDLVGNDSGGAVAQLFVTRHPERVRTLLLTNCDTEHESPPAAMQPVIALSHQGKFADQWLAPWLADKKLARSPQGIGGMCFERPAQLSDATLEAYLRPLVSTPQRKQRMHAYAVALEANSLSGIGPALKASQAPVRVLWGMADDIFLPHGADHLAQAFGNSKGVRRLDGATLFWPEERPDLIAQEARALWQA